MTKEVTADEKLVKVEVEVTNIGKVYPGREVVQVYYSAPDGVMEKPTQELAGFAKTKLLMPGEKEVVTKLHLRQKIWHLMTAMMQSMGHGGRRVYDSCGEQFTYNGSSRDHRSG